MARLILDANMMLVFVIGSVSPGLLGTTKRVKEYRPSDYDLLCTYISLFDSVILLPNIVSEASNLVDHLKGDRRQDCMVLLANLARVSREQYVPSNFVVEQPEYMNIGITDAAILCAMQPETYLLTADQDLFLAAIYREHQAQYFKHLRDDSY